MAYDEGMAEVMREDLAAVPGIVEKRMFGGLAFMLDGNMVCGVNSEGGMFRVGKENQAAALAIEGVLPMAFTGRVMAGFVDAPDEVMADDDRRGALMSLALAHVRGLPPK